MKLSTSVLAITALVGGAGYALAEVTGNNASTYDAAVSVLSPDQTGFIIGGQVSVNGLGSGSLTLTRSAAEMSLTGGASSGLSGTSAAPAGVNTDSLIESTINFDRNVTTTGSLVGQGNVVSTGQAIASMGSAGAASSKSTTAGTNGSGEGSATSESTSQGSLNGSLSTSNSLQLLGTSGLFAGSNGASVGESNQALAYGATDVTADTGTTGLNLKSAAIDSESLPATGETNSLLRGTGYGALFAVQSSLTSKTGTADSDPQGIKLSVSNAGNGTIAITTSTGGFFTGGGAAGGSSALSQSGSFFAAP